MYLDDIIILGSSFDDHLQNLQLVFERVQKAGLKLQPKKCAFLQTSVAYLGHIVSREGVSTDLPRSRKWLLGQCLQTERRSRGSWALLAIIDDSSKILLR